MNGPALLAVRLRGAPDGGQADLLLNGVTIYTNADTYDTSYRLSTYYLGMVGPGRHTVTAKVRGSKQASSVGTWVRVAAVGSLTPTPQADDAAIFGTLDDFSTPTSTTYANNDDGAVSYRDMFGSNKLGVEIVRDITAGSGLLRTAGTAAGAFVRDLLSRTLAATRGI